MNPYLAGLLTIPAAWIAMQIVYMSFKCTLWLAGKVTVTLVKVSKPEAGEGHRVRLAAMTYAAERVWILGSQDFGIGFFQGQRDGAASELRERMTKKFNIETMSLEYDDNPS